jgi:hypothetical protein
VAQKSTKKEPMYLITDMFGQNKLVTEEEFLWDWHKKNLQKVMDSILGKQSYSSPAGTALNSADKIEKMVDGMGKQQQALNKQFASGSKPAAIDVNVRFPSSTTVTFDSKGNSKLTTTIRY